METRISSISQLDEVSVLQPDDLFVISEPSEYTLGEDFTKTGYISKKLPFAKFSDYLSVLVLQDLVNKISNISGNVYTYTSTLNYVTGTLIQNINTQIDHVSGNVNVALTSLNHVSGDMIQNLSTNISNISGNVSSVAQLETNVNAVSAHIENNIDTTITQVTGDIYLTGGIYDQIESLTAQVYNNLTQSVSKIVGDVYSAAGINNVLSTVSADVYNKIELLLDDITGDVYISGGIFNYVSANTANINSIINDLNELCAAMHYPIVQLNDIDDDHTTIDYVLRDKSVNVITLLEDTPCNITFSTLVTNRDDLKYSRDFELVVYCYATPTIKWDENIQYMSPDDADIMTSFDLNATYIYYFSEIADNVFYVSRQELNDITSEVVKAPQ